MLLRHEENRFPILFKDIFKVDICSVQLCHQSMHKQETAFNGCPVATLCKNKFNHKFFITLSEKEVITIISENIIYC